MTALLLLTSLLATASAADVKFMGWGDVTITETFNDPEVPVFDVPHLYFMADAHANDHWSLFTEIEFEHAPVFEAGKEHGEIKVDRAYIQFQSGAGRLRFGKFNTPYGIRIPTHWVLLTPILAKPFHEDRKYVPNKALGIEAFRTFKLSKSTINTTLTLHNGAEGTGLNTTFEESIHGESGTESEDENLDGISAGGIDIAWVYDSFYTVGASYQHQSAAESTENLAHSAVAYVNLLLPANLLLRAEQTIHHTMNQEMVQTRYIVGTYTIHGFDELTVAYRFGQVSGQNPAVSHTGNLSWTPAEAVRVVAEGNAVQETQGPWVISTQLWMGLSF